MVGAGLRNIMALPAIEDTYESTWSTDRDFDGWIANDPMVTGMTPRVFSPASSAGAAGSMEKRTEGGD